jgi:hypothetical protein
LEKRLADIFFFTTFGAQYDKHNKIFPILF